MLSVSEASLFRINTEILHFVQNDIHMEFAFFNIHVGALLAAP